MTFVPGSLNSFELQALRYIRNTGNNATQAQFNEDHEPIGPSLWEKITTKGWATINEDGKVALTDAGKSIVDAQDP
jgi:hypothetical protein